MEPLKLEFEVSREEHEEAWRVLVRSAPRSRNLMRIGAVVAMAAAVFLGGVMEDAGARLNAAALGAFGLFVLVVEIQRDDRRFREGSARFSRAAGRVTCEFSDDGVRARGDFSCVEHRWQAFERFQESRGLLLLYHRSGSHSIIPKRAADPSQLDELHRLLGTHLSGPTGGFPVLPAKR